MFPSHQDISLSDYGGQKSNIHFEVVELTAANLDLQMSYQDNLMNKIFALTRGTLHVRKRTLFIVKGWNPQSSDPLAQRELKWLLLYSDDVTGKEYKREMPTAKLTTGAQGTLLPNSEAANFAADLWIDFKAAFELVVISPVGNPVTLISAVVVGRNT